MSQTFYVLLAVSIVMLLVGYIGSIVPGIAGPPFSFLGLLSIAFIDGIEFPIWFLVVMGIIGFIIYVVDFFIPVWGTKIFGGTKAGTRGSLIGLLIGIVLSCFTGFGFVVMFAGPFFGAYVGEKIAKTPEREAWLASLGVFLGFVIGTGIKLVYAVICTIFVVVSLLVYFYGIFF